jgi:hypothetical protein
MRFIHGGAFAMASFLGGLFGSSARQTASSLPRPRMPRHEEISGERYFQITDGHQQLSAPLTDHVLWTKEHGRLRELRRDAYAALHPRGFRPEDSLFFPWVALPIDPAHVPTELVMKKSAPKTPHEYTTYHQAMVVSDRVRRAIEATDRGRHAFFPFDLVSADGERRPCHFVQELEAVDCVDPELSGMAPQRRQDGGEYWIHPDPVDWPPVALDMDRVGGRHFFFVTGATSVLHSRFISGTLADMLGDFLPRGVYLRPCRVTRRL